ncbi:MAG: phospholipase D-like domain-containing protein [Wolinella sp.]
MPTFARFLISVLIFSRVLYGGEEFYLMPEEQKSALNALINFIEESKESLDIAIYAFTNREIAKSIKKIAKNGVKVHIIYDEHQADQKSHSTIGYLAKYQNIEVCTLQGNRAENGNYRGLMHMKMAVSDQKRILLGSANWSKNAFENSYETLVISQNVEMIKKAKQYLNKMKQRCQPY